MGIFTSELCFRASSLVLTFSHLHSNEQYLHKPGEFLGVHAINIQRFPVLKFQAVYYATRTFIIVHKNDSAARRSAVGINKHSKPNVVLSGSQLLLNVGSQFRMTTALVKLPNEK